MFGARRGRGKLDSALPRFQSELVRRILVIDDEPLVALMIRRTLEPDHEVTVLHSGRAALLLFEQGARFDAIVTDLQMPDGDGAWLHGELARLDAAQARRMLFLSGAQHPFLEGAGLRWLLKPFRSKELIAEIEAAATAP
jgi:CheY-like chemotaxis protein